MLHHMILKFDEQVYILLNDAKLKHISINVPQFGLNFFLCGSFTFPQYTCTHAISNLYAMLWEDRYRMNKLIMNTFAHNLCVYP